MESAGKRATRPPDYLRMELEKSNKISGKMVSTTTCTTDITDTTTSVISPILKPTPVDPSSIAATGSGMVSSDATLLAIHNMMKDLRSDLQRTEARNETQHSLNQECLRRWQEIDTRLTRTEDTVVKHDVRMLEQQSVNVQVTNRLHQLEEEVVAMRRDLVRLVAPKTPPKIAETYNTPLSTSLLSSTIPNYSSIVNQSQSTSIPGFMTSSSNPISTTMGTEAFRSSVYGNTERLNDVVSEFSGHHGKVHPEKFLQECHNYFIGIPMSEDQRLNAVQRRLTKDAKIWYDSLMPSPMSYEEFVVSFREQFWSIDIQRRVYDDIFRPFQYTSMSGLSTHAMLWITKAKYLNPPISQLSLINTIIQHYPYHLAIAIRGRGPKTTNEFLSILAEFESINSFCSQPQSGQLTTPSRNNGNQSNNRGRWSGNRRSEGYNQTSHGGSSSEPNNQPAQVQQLNVTGNAAGSHQ